MADLSQSTAYLLTRDYHEAVRLESQHLLWSLHTGYTIHPEIPIANDMAVADLGAGSGIWALELSTLIPATARITGYDISDSAFPSKEYWPDNTSFEILDCLGDIPAELQGQFDVVHLRMWALIIRENDPSVLIRNAVKMLKPGGHLQWEDARFNSVVTRGEAAERVRELMRAANTATRTDFRWLDSLPAHTTLVAPNLSILHHANNPWSARHLIPLCMHTFLLALESSGRMLDQLRKIVPIEGIPDQAEWNSALAALHEDIRGLPNGTGVGGQYFWEPVVFLGRKEGGS
ncbi:hypothetical protein BJX64DRAFT_80527 [Aspergillus heterothallicus]